MTYPAALTLQTLALRGQLALWQLAWDARGLAPLTTSRKSQLEEDMATGFAAIRLLWEAGIRFSFTRPLTEAECVGRPGWHPARREAP